VLTQLSQPKFYLVRSKGKVKLSLFNEEQVPNHFTDPIDAINEFFFLKTTTGTLEREKGILLKKLISNIEGSESYIAKNKSKLNEITDITKYKAWADILMANLHQIEKGSKQITLSDFNGVPVTIKLKPELTAQKNAEIFYRKAKNQEIEIRKISESIDQKKKEIESSQKLIEGLEKITTLSEFKLQFGSAKTKKSKKEESLPFHQSEHLGYQILIGKNAAANDLLTLKYAHKDDLWLHAKDVSGSHVVVKHKSGQPFPKEVIERAAELAAYNSKRKSETLCPVSYTHKKFVRKRKGDPAGAVVVEREQVIMVTPKMI
ncbi:MAG: NFACT RNA binding domain-containing protein, partial [Cyclobacteriaceae bacterium]